MRNQQNQQNQRSRGPSGQQSGRGSESQRPENSSSTKGQNGGRGGRGGNESYGYDSGYDRDLDREMENGGYNPRGYRNDQAADAEFNGRGPGRQGGSMNDGRAGANRWGSERNGGGSRGEWEGNRQAGGQEQGGRGNGGAERQGRESGRDAASQGQHAGRGPKGYRRSDARIEEDVNEALTQDGEIDASEITVQVQGGEVTLTGTVEDRDAKRHAEDVVERCAGVIDVHNQLKVGPATSEKGAMQGTESQAVKGKRGGK